MLAELRKGSDDGWTLATWLTTRLDQLDGKSALEWLTERRDPAPVIGLARNDAAAWAA